MSPKEFAAWLAGFNEANGDGPPNEDQWAMILELAEEMANPPAPAPVKTDDPLKTHKDAPFDIHRFTPGEGSLLGKLDMRGYVKGKTTLVDLDVMRRRAVDGLSFGDIPLQGGAKPLDEKKLEATRLEQLRKRALKS